MDEEAILKVIKKIFKKEIKREMASEKRFTTLVNSDRHSYITFSVSMSELMLNRLTNLAKRIGVNRSELIRHCIYQSVPILEAKQSVIENPDKHHLIIDGKEIRIIGEA